MKRGHLTPACEHGTWTFAGTFEALAHDQVLLHGVTMLLTGTFSSSTNLLAYFRIQQVGMTDERMSAETLQLIEKQPQPPLRDAVELHSGLSEADPAGA